MKNFLSPVKRGSCLIILFLFNFGLIAQSSDKAKMSVVSSLEDVNLEWGPCPEFMPEGCNVAILHGDPEIGNFDVLFKVEANSDIPEHWHNSAERMILIGGEMEITYEGEKTRSLKIGSYLYGPAKKAHKGRCLDAGPCTLFIAFEEPLDAFEGIKQN
jgi:quercetin dioxygenase-like cupin family protein